MSVITIFSTPKSFADSHINIIQRNAIKSWTLLGPDVEVMLIGNDPGTAEVAEEMNVKHIPNVLCNEKGTPLVSSIFDLARQQSTSPLLCYVNADIIFLPDFVETVKRIHSIKKEFLLVGQRWDMDMKELINYSGNWADRLQRSIQEDGVLHPPAGSDYFMFPRKVFVEIPDFAIGRAGWDNWMIYEAHNKGWALIDGTNSVNIIHQNHDYRHLPGGQTHYKLDESIRNVDLAGGKEQQFTLLDCDFQIKSGELIRTPVSLQKLLGEIIRALYGIKTHNKIFKKIIHYCTRAILMISRLIKKLGTRSLR